MNCKVCGQQKRLLDFGWVGDECTECFDLSIEILKQKDRIMKYKREDLTLKELLQRSYKEELK